MIHFRQHDRRPADRRLSDQIWSVPCKVGTPLVPAGMKKLRQPAALRVETGDVWSLMKIVVRTREGKIPVGRLPTMLLYDDVVDREGEFRNLGRDLAIFGAVAGSCPDAAVKRFVHGSRFLAGLLAGKHCLSLQY